MNLDKEIQSFRDDRSMEMYGKPEAQLQLGERQRLDEYIKDYINPIWKPIIIDGKETGYIVSNIGKFRSTNGLQYRFVNYKDPNWYRSIYFPKYKNAFLVHRLVAQAFIPNPGNKPQVNHKNGNKHFNWVGNLEWCTAKENSEHAWKYGLVDNSGDKQKNSIYTNDQIHEVCKMLEDGKKYKEISSATGVKIKTISEILVRHSWTSISINYKLPLPRVPKYSDNDIKKVCELLENHNISHKEISQITNVSISAIKDIMKGTSYKRISKYYNIKKRLNCGESCYMHKYTEKQVEKVCSMLENPDFSYSQIYNKTGVKVSTIHDILHSLKWKHVSKKYNFDKRLNKI